MVVIGPDNVDVPVIILPRDESKFLAFLVKEGFNPVKKPDNRSGSGVAIFVSKPYSYYEMNEKWQEYSGYAAILKKYLEKSS